MSIRVFDTYIANTIPESYGYTNNAMEGQIIGNFLKAKGSNGSYYRKTLSDLDDINGLIVDFEIYGSDANSTNCNTISIADREGKGFELKFKHTNTGLDSVVLIGSTDIYLITLKQDYLLNNHYFKIKVVDDEIKVEIDGVDQEIEMPLKESMTINQVNMASYLGIGYINYYWNYFNISYLEGTGTGYGEGGYGEGYFGGEEFIDITDSIGKQWDTVKTAIGDADTMSTSAYGAYKNIERIEETGEVELIEQVLNGSIDTYSKMTGKYVFKLWENLIDQLIYSYGSLENYFDYFNKKCSPEFAEIARYYFDIKPSYVYSPETNMGEFLYSGTNAGTFTDKEWINTKLYDPQYLTIKLLTEFTNTATVAVKYKKYDGTEITENRVIPAASATGTEYTLTTAKGYDVINISSVSGGSAGYKLKVYAKRQFEIDF